MYIHTHYILFHITSLPPPCLSLSLALQLSRIITSDKRKLEASVINRVITINIAIRAKMFWLPIESRVELRVVINVRVRV